MSKLNVKVIDVCDDRFSIVKTSDGLSKLLETSINTKLKLNQTYLLLKSTEYKDYIKQGNLKPIKIADMSVKDNKRDKLQDMRKLYEVKKQEKQTNEVGKEGIKSFANNNLKKDIDSVELQVTGKVVRFQEKDGQFGKYSILDVKDIEDKKITVMVYHKIGELEVGDVVQIIKLKYTKRQKDNIDSKVVYVQTTFYSKMVKVTYGLENLFKNISYGDIKMEGKFSGVTGSRIYYSCDKCSSKCMDEEPVDEMKCPKCGKLTKPKKDFYIEIVVEVKEEVVFLLIFKKIFEIKEISELNPQRCESLDEAVINIFNEKNIVFHANYDKNMNEGNKLIVVKLFIK